MLMLSSVLVDENNPLHIRNAASLALKNALTARVRLDNHLFFFLFKNCLFSLSFGSDLRKAHGKQI